MGNEGKWLKSNNNYLKLMLKGQNRKEELKKLLLIGKQVAVFSKLEKFVYKGIEKVKKPNEKVKKPASSRIMKLQSQRTLWEYPGEEVHLCGRLSEVIPAPDQHTFCGSCTIAQRKFVADAKTDHLAALPTTSSGLGCPHSVCSRPSSKRARWCPTDLPPGEDVKILGPVNS